MLATRLRSAALEEIRRPKPAGHVHLPVGEGVGDVTYALDRATELAAGTWHREIASHSPISLFTEDAGWRHLLPDGQGGSREGLGFDHGGPRVVLDPVDGTRNLMADLRSAWTVIALCAAGVEEPRLSEVRLGVVSELPDSRAERFRVFTAARGAGARLALRELGSDAELETRPLKVDDDGRADHGYFSFFRYTPAQRPLLARLEADFFSRLAREEGADLRHAFDDQYISNGGQLALLSSGTYRFIADLRAHFASSIEVECTTSKPYDCAGAILIALEAGCRITNARGDELDFPLDGKTPVSFVGYANHATATRLAPHLAAALAGL